MPKEEETKQIEKTEEVISTEVANVTETEIIEPEAENSKSIQIGPKNRNFKDRRKNERRPRKPERTRQEFDNKILNVRRVTRVVAGGRRFSFSVAIVVGDKKGRVGVGTGKSADTPIAVDKAMRDAKKNLMIVTLNKRGSISHPVEAKYSSARISIMPAPGKGIIAGSSARAVLELAGAKEVSAKILSKSKNKLNIAQATIKALKKLKKDKVGNLEK